MSQLQQQYHFVEVYDDGTRHCLKKSQIKQDSELSVINYNYINKQESEILPDIEAIESNSSDQSSMCILKAHFLTIIFYIRKFSYYYSMVQY